MDEYEEKYEQLLEEKKKVELEFGLARRRFKELYVGCENQLNNEKETSRQLQIQVEELTRQIDAFKVENEGIRIAVKLSEEVKEEEFADLKAKHEEEIASMQHIWTESAQDNQNRLLKGFEEEKKKLLTVNAKLEQKLRQMEGGSNIGNQNGGHNNSIGVAMSNALPSRKPPTQSSKGVDLSEQQERKSVVEPLEREIESLRKQLSETVLQLKDAQSAKQTSSMGKKSDKEFMLNEELKEAQKYFKSEKSARTDLEMYVAVLNTQKTVLQEDSDKLKRELHNVCRLFEQEKMSHNELKQTWKLANDQFLMQQQNLISELEITKMILTPSQREQLSKSIFSDSSKAIKTVAEHPYQVTAAKKTGVSNDAGNDNLIDFDSTGFSQQAKQLPTTVKHTSNEPVSLTKEIFSAAFPAAYQAKQFNAMLSEETNIREQPLILSSSSDSEDDNLEEEIRIQNLKRYAVEEGVEVHNDNNSTQDAMFSKTNPVAMLEDFDDNMTLKKSTSTDGVLHLTGVDPESPLEKSQSQGDISWSSNNTDLLNLHDKSGVTGDSVWNNVSEEYTRTCMMCQNYEKQLQHLQKDNMTIKEREQAHIDKTKSLQHELDTQKEIIVALGKDIETVSADNKTHLSIYEKNQQEVDKQVLLVENQFQEFQMNILKEVKALSEKVVT